MMGLQFALVARIKSVSSHFGIDVMLQYHRQIAYVALVFILAHPILLFIQSTKFLALLNPFTAPLRAHMAVLSTLALILLIALSIWRKRLRMGYETWQLTHGVLAVIVVAAALTHVLLVDYYVNEPWERVLWIAMSGAFVALLVWVRVLVPVRRIRRPWRVDEVIPERGASRTMVLKPEHSNGFAFEPGQFAWIMVEKSPFAITQHPFSISSSAERPDRVALTVKSAGDITSALDGLDPGTTVYLDGPHGSFSVDRYEGPGFVLIGAGVGVTPLMSMMRTLADREDARPIYLFLGNRNQGNITFIEEIEALKARIDLAVVHVLSQPEEGWEGEVGHLSVDVFRRHLPKRYERLQYFICGSEAMMDTVEKSLSEIGIPEEKVHSERFGMV
jgi:predicted ferric reductase